MIPLVDRVRAYALWAVVELFVYVLAVSAAQRPLRRWQAPHVVAVGRLRRRGLRRAIAGRW